MRLAAAVLQSSVVVAVPASEIDPVFLHPDGLPLWDESVARVELLSRGPLRPGSRFDTIDPRREKRTSYVVVELSPEMWRTRLVGSHILSDAEWTMHVEPLDGRTRVTCTVDMRFHRISLPLALLFRRLTSRLDRDLRLLGSAIERRRLTRRESQL